MMFVMNDYELIYLIQHEHDDHALNFMFKKYHKFIWKQVHLLHVEPKEQDDFHQEGQIMLFKALKTFNEAKNKSFMRYFELILKRHFYQMKRKIPDYTLYEHTDFCKGVTYLEEEPLSIDLKSDLEKDIYEAYFMHRMTIEDIHKETSYSKKQIYNTIYRIKEKYKIMI